MSQNTETPAPSPADETDPIAAAIAALTAAARRTRTRGAAGTEHEVVEPVDFGEIACHVLTAVAANVGGVDALLAGRPGSWEADYVRRIVHSTAGEDAADLAAYRTEPIRVWLDVEVQLDEQTGDEWQAAWSRLADQAGDVYEDAYAAALERHAGNPRIVSEQDRRLLDGSLGRPELSAEARSLWERVRAEGDWLVEVDPQVGAAWWLTQAVSTARDAAELDYKGRLFATMQAAAAARGYTVELTPSADFDADNWLGNDLEAEARAVTPVPAVPTLDELR